MELYLEEKKELPSAHMTELVSEGYLERVIQKMVEEDPNIYQEVLPVLTYKTRTLEDLLTTYNGEDPHLLIKFTNKEGQDDWHLTSRKDLRDEQIVYLKTIQDGVNQYKEENGTYPEKLTDLIGNKYFNASESIFEDPLGGEFVLNRETGKVEAINPQY